MTDKILSRQTEQNAQKAVLAVLILLGIYFTVRFYWNVLGFIELWASDEFVDLFKALFNLTVLLLVGAVFVHQLRRLRERGAEWDEGVVDENESEESVEDEWESKSVEDNESHVQEESVEGGEGKEENEPVESGEGGGESVESGQDEEEDDDDVPWKQYGEVDREDT